MTEICGTCEVFQLFPIWNAVRSELSWTHYRRLLGVHNEKARQWYMNEAATQNWSSRALDRQILTLHYERLLQSRDKTPATEEATTNTQAMKNSPERTARRTQSRTGIDRGSPAQSIHGVEPADCSLASSRLSLATATFETRECSEHVCTGRD